MFKVAVTDQTHKLRFYEYEYETLAEAEEHYEVEGFNALLMETNDGKETLIKSK